MTLTSDRDRNHLFAIRNLNLNFFSRELASKSDESIVL